MSDRDHEKADVTLASTARQRTVWGYDEFYASTHLHLAPLGMSELLSV
jgi:hypothetical protein